MAVVTVSLPQCVSGHVQGRAAMTAVVAQAFRHRSEPLTRSIRGCEVVDRLAAVRTVGSHRSGRMTAGEAAADNRAVGRGGVCSHRLSTRR